MSSKRISLGSTRRATPPLGPLANPAGAVGVGHRPVEGFDDVQQADFAWIHPKGEAASRALAGTQQTLAGELLQYLGQEMSRNLFLLRDVLHHGILAFLHLRQVNKGANCVLGRSRIDHQSPPYNSE